MICQKIQHMVLLHCSTQCPGGLGFEKLECKVDFHLKVITNLDDLSEILKHEILKQ